MRARTAAAKDLRSSALSTSLTALDTSLGLQQKSQGCSPTEGLQGPLAAQQRRRRRQQQEQQQQQSMKSKVQQQQQQPR